MSCPELRPPRARARYELKLQGAQMKEYTTREKQGNEQRNLWDKRPGTDTVVREGEREGVGRT